MLRRWRVWSFADAIPLGRRRRALRAKGLRTEPTLPATQLHGCQLVLRKLAV